MKGVLGLICLALVAVIVWQWRDWPPSRGGVLDTRAEGAGQAPDVKQPESQVLLIPLLNKDDYVSVTERPLFLTGRRPPEEEAPGDLAVPEVPVAEVPLENLDLSAVIITPSGAIAWIITPNHPKPQKVQLGDELEGWKVKRISNDEVEMEGQGGSDRLVLRNFSQHETPVPTPSPRGERRNPARPPANRSPATNRQAGQKPPSTTARMRSPSAPGANLTRNTP